MCFAVTVACNVLCDYLFSGLTSVLVASDVAIYSGSRVGSPGHKTSFYLIMRVTSLGLGIRPVFPLSKSCANLSPLPLLIACDI